MTFVMTDQHVHDFYQNGYTVFRGIIPPSLIADLRRVTDRGRQLVRAMKSDQPQRFQPVADFEIDQRPFEDYMNLPELREALNRILSPRHIFGGTSVMAVLIEPEHHPYCLQWHRDLRHLFEDEVEWNATFTSHDNGNQVNCPLWEDSSMWYVPGSHVRDDLMRERAAFNDFPLSGPILDGLSDEARERACLEYCRGMPGAIPLHLNAGDFALYRQMGWHTGNYLPYRKRATLHDNAWIPEEAQRWSRRRKELESLKEVDSRPALFPSSKDSRGSANGAKAVTTAGG